MYALDGRDEVTLTAVAKQKERCHQRGEHGLKDDDGCTEYDGCCPAWSGVTGQEKAQGEDDG